VNFVLRNVELYRKRKTFGRETETFAEIRKYVTSSNLRGN
jgi:hypothetical protein